MKNGKGISIVETQYSSKCINIASPKIPKLIEKRKITPITPPPPPPFASSSVTQNLFTNSVSQSSYTNSISQNSVLNCQKMDELEIIGGSDMDISEASGDLLDEEKQEQLYLQSLAQPLAKLNNFTMLKNMFQNQGYC